MLARAQGLQLCNFCVLMCVVGGREGESSVCCDVFYWAARIPACTLVIEIQEYNHWRIETKETKEKNVCVSGNIYTFLLIIYLFSCTHRKRGLGVCTSMCLSCVTSLAWNHRPWTPQSELLLGVRADIYFHSTHQEECFVWLSDLTTNLKSEKAVSGETFETLK